MCTPSSPVLTDGIYFQNRFVSTIYSITELLPVIPAREKNNEACKHYIYIFLFAISKEGTNDSVRNLTECLIAQSPCTVNLPC